MTLCFAELRKKLGNSGVIYPSEILGKIDKYPDGIVQPGSVLVEDTPIPALFFVCPEADIEYLLKAEEAHGCDRRDGFGPDRAEETEGCLGLPISLTVL